MTTDAELDAIRRRWSRDGGMGNERSEEDYNDVSCRALARYGFDDVNVLLSLVDSLRDAIGGERLMAAMADHGRDRHWWEDDPLVIENGWLDGRCRRCGWMIQPD